MIKYLALLVCGAFVWHLLKFDRQQAAKVSPWLWLPTFWMLICASKPLGVWLGSGGDFSSGSAVDRNFLTGIFCAGFVILLKRKFRWSRAFRQNRWLFVLLGYMLISLLWADDPFVSFKRWFRELGAVIMAFVVLSDPSPRQAMQSLFRRMTYILIPFSLVLIKYIPALGVEFHHWTGERMWIGVALQKNGLGRLCVICGFFLIWTFIRRRQGRAAPVCKQQTYAEVFLLGLTFWLLKGPGGAYPATAVVVLVLGIVMYCGLSWMRKRHLKVSPVGMMALLTFLLAYGIFTPYISGSFLGDFLEMLGRNPTFTGRTEIWGTLMPIAAQQPWFGLGFGSFWTPITRFQLTVGEAHNGYLDMVLDLGYVGLFLLGIFLLSSCRKAVKGLKVDFDWASLWICLLFMAVLHNATESSLNSLASHLTALLVFLSVSFPAIAASGDDEDVDPLRNPSKKEPEFIDVGARSRGLPRSTLGGTRFG